MDHQDYLVMREQIETIQWEVENLNHKIRVLSACFFISTVLMFISIQLKTN